MAGSLQGTHVVVTGAGGGLGPSVAEAFRAAGAIVHAPARAELDLLDEAAVAKYYAALPALWASVHVAGGFSMAPVTETSLDDFMAQWRINTVTTFLACREAVRRMRAGALVPGPNGPAVGQAGGRIVNVAARAAIDHPGGKIAYVSAKSALAGLTRSLAAECRAEGIFANAVLPDTIDTPANRAAMPGADHSQWTRPEAIASAILWLASPGNATVTGALLPV
ncbi:MAG: SDR family NAD(P)-dependent oxidoreductase [Fibrobacteres bacterium]|jgi:NAD(P)-dependent dehydrogenase (short-subunit alcohol dehydrogenase family)|nr:SDR family NAD(P)-dependent oxidoreductase [Fibrobacterota bacterium]